MPRVLIPLAAMLMGFALLAIGCGHGATSHGRQTNEAPQASVQVGLIEFSLTPSTASVRQGPIRFTAVNQSTSMTHELAVLRVKDDGSFENEGEVEDLAPGASGSITLDLPAGRYQLACLIAAGEADSPVDHYQQGMHTGFTVTP